MNDTYLYQLDSESLVQEYIVTNTEEYRPAKKLVLERSNLQDKIKKILKSQGKTKCTVQLDNNNTATIAFDVKVYDRVDTTLLPEDIKMLYTRQVEVWRENITQ